MEMIKRVLEMLQRQERGILVTVIDADPHEQDCIGGHWIWREGKGWDIPPLQTDSELMKRSPKCTQTLLRWNEEVQTDLTIVCKEMLQQGQFRRERLEAGERWLDLMLEPIIPLPRLVILGCGHVGQALAKLAHIAGWPITVVDDRPDFANVHLFPPETIVHCGDFLETVRSLHLAESDYVVIVTRGHQYDRICLEALHGRVLAYLGMIGSRRRVRGLMEELIKVGFDDQWLASIHSPIGLNICAETPEEIAVSIMAEMIQVRRRGASDESGIL